MKKTITIFAVVLLLVTMLWAANTKMRNLAIIASTIDSTTIGNTQPSTGVFTNFQFWSFSGCALGTGQPNSCFGTATLPVAFVDNNYTVQCTAQSGNAASVYVGLTTVFSAGSFPYVLTVGMINGAGGPTPTVHCVAHHN